MRDARTVAVGLDVHKSSVRLAAVRAGEVVREVTLPYDRERVAHELRAWPGARVVYEAGPTGSGFTGIWSRRVSSARSWRRGWCRRGPVIA